MNERADAAQSRSEYDPERDMYRASFDLNGRYSLFSAILTAVEDATGQGQSTMEPLFDVVDPEALETLFEPPGAQTVRVEFDYCGCQVITRSDGTVLVTNQEDR